MRLKNMYNQPPMTIHSMPTETTSPSWAKFRSRVSGGVVAAGATVFAAAGAAVFVSVGEAWITGDGEAWLVGAG